MNTLTKGLIASAACWVMASCGGGGGVDLAGGGIGGTGISGGIGGSGISQGPITGFGSVYVNGIKFEETGAIIEVEGIAVPRTDLKIGMVVNIAWERDTAGVYTAKSIVYNDDVQGPVAAKVVDATTRDVRFTVLGQTVVANPTTTAFDKVTAEALEDGHIVEVSGLRGAAGVLYATRVELKKTVADQGEIFELRGTVANLNSGATTFMLGTAIVNYSGLTAPAVGDCVEVTSTAGLNSNGQLIATAIELKDSCTPGGSAGQELTLKGFPSAIDKTGNTFTVNGQQVNYSNATFPLGKNEENLSETAIVEVEGSLSGTVLIARKISFEVEGGLNVTGRAQEPITNDTLMLAAATPDTFAVNNLTVYEDDSASPISNFGRGSIVAGHTLKVYYYTDTSGKHVATRIKRED